MLYINCSLRWIIAFTLAGTLVTSVGCVNLDKPTTSIKAPIQKPVKEMIKATKLDGGSFVNKVKQAMPKMKPRVQIADAPIADNDPTRLDNMPDKLGPELYLAAARMAEQTGRPEMALEQYNKALQVDGNNRNALIGLARLHHRVGDVDKAIQIYRNAMNTYRADPVIMNDLGLCYARNGQLNEAISVLETATRTAPKREMYVNNLAAALVEANRTSEAVTHLSRLQAPEKANYQVAFLLDQAGRKSEATNYLNQALAINPNMAEARALLNQTAPQVTAQPPELRVARRDERVAPPANGYTIPVSQQENFTPVQQPAEVARPAGNLPAVAPAETPTHLEERPHRFGPFGFVPPRDANEIQVVSYVEDVVE